MSCANSRFICFTSLYLGCTTYNRAINSASWSKQLSKIHIKVTVNTQQTWICSSTKIQTQGNHSIKVNQIRRRSDNCQFRIKHPATQNNTQKSQLKSSIKFAMTAIKWMKNKVGGTCKNHNKLHITQQNSNSQISKSNDLAITTPKWMAITLRKGWIAHKTLFST